MTARQCHHDSTTHDYGTPQHGTLRIDRVCDRCDKTLQTFWANAEETTMSDYTPTTGEVRADTLRHAARDIPTAYQHGDSPSAWLTRRADQEEAK